MTRAASARRLVVVAAMLYLAVSALPIAAAETNVAVGSKHTTASDFNGAATLDNVTVSGSGTSAHVALSRMRAGQIIEDAEHFDGSNYTGNTSQFSQNSTTVKQGSFSIRGLTSGTEHRIVSTSGLDKYPDQGDTWQLWVNTGEANFLRTEFAVQDADNLYSIVLGANSDDLILRERASGSETALDSATVTELAANTWFQIQVDWGTNNDINVTLLNESGGQLATISANDGTFTDGGIGFALNTPGIETDADAFWDFERTIHPANRGTYVSDNHSVSNATSCFTDLTLDNASATVTCQKFSGGSFTDVASQTFTSGGNKSLDLSGHESAETWRVNVTFDTNDAFNASTATFDSSTNVSSEESTLRGVAFGDGGSKMYAVGANSDAVQQYDLGTTFEVSTATHNRSFSVSSEDGVPRSVAFGDGGAKMYVAGAASADIFEYDLAEAWNVSTAVLNDSLNVGPQDSTPTGVTLRADGSALFVAGNDNDSVFKWDLATTWDVSSAAFNQSLDVSTEDTAPLGLDLADDGAVLSIAANTGQNVDQWTLATRWDLSTASHARTFDVSGEDATPVGVEFDGAGTNMYVAGAQTTRVLQYTLSESTTAQLHNEGVQFTNAHPQINNSSATPSGGTTTASNDVTLNISVNDTTFSRPQGDSVVVEFFVDGNSEGTKTLGSNGTASLGVTVSSGSHTWSVNATDDWGGTTPSQQFSFGTPANLTIRNESNPDEIIKPDEVTCAFFTLDGSVQNNLAERNTTTGNISLGGLPTADEFVVQCSATDFHTRTILLKSLTSQSNIYLINSTGAAATVNVQLSLQDSTGLFPTSETRIQLERALNQSGNLSFRVVSGDIFGAAGTFRDTLINDARYKITIENTDGDSRELGPYTATTDETATLSVGNLTFDVQGNEGYQWSANQTATAVKFNYSDPDSNTTDLDVQIYERGNESNVLQVFEDADPGTSHSFTAVLSADQQDMSWVVEWNATYERTNGSTVEIGATALTGPRQDAPGVPLAQEWKNRFSIFLILIFAGAFSGRFNAAMGTLAVPILAGILWYIGWLPNAVGAAAIVVALFVGAVTVGRTQR